MALKVAQITRQFIVDKGNGKKEVLADPNESLSPQEVLKFYSGQLAELTNAIIEGPKVEKDKATYTISTKAGKLG